MTAPNADPEEETQAAHVIRDGKIICTVLIEPAGNDQWIVRREGEIGLTVYSEPPCAEEFAVALGGAYLEGYAHGYDDAITTEFKTKETDS